MRFLYNAALSLMMAFSLAGATIALQPQIAFAADPAPQCTKADEICASGLPRTTTGTRFVQNAMQIVIGVVAVVSVLFVAIGGLRYVFSQGDPQGVTKAKSTIVYALIGLAVAILAQAVVIFVVKTVLS